MCDYFSTPSRRNAVGRLRVGRLQNLFVVSYQRRTLGPKYKGAFLLMCMEQHLVMPQRVDNFYRCAKDSATETVFVRVEDLCTLLAEVPDRPSREHLGDPDMVNLLPLAHAFPVSWISE